MAAARVTITLLSVDEDELRRRILQTNSPKTTCPPKTNYFPKTNSPKANWFPNTNYFPKTNSEDEFPEDEWPPEEDEFPEGELVPEDELLPEDKL